jgi:hypothetical protein
MATGKVEIRWVVVQTGTTRPLSQHDTEAEALDAAQLLGPGHMVKRGGFNGRPSTDQA